MDLPVSRAKNLLKYKIFLVLGLVFFSSFVFISPNLAYSYIFPDSIIKGVTVNGVNVGGLNRGEALLALEGIVKSSSLLQVAFEQDQKISWVHSFAELGLSVDVKQAVDLALNSGKEGNFSQRSRFVRQAREKGIEIPLTYRMDGEKANKIINKIAAEGALAPVNPTFKVSDQGEVTVIPGKKGQVVITADLLNALQTLEGMPKNVNIPVTFDEVQPELKEDQIRAMAPKAVVASMSTKFDPVNQPRVNNIIVGSKALHNYFLAPGEIFSFNQVVGPRDVESGFQIAKVILKGKLVPGLGGGICQVSSTLYNAVLRADLEIVQRSNHSLKVGYLPLGTDATVAYDFIDFKFRNNTKGYIRLTSNVIGDKVTIDIWGDPKIMMGKKIEVISVVDKVVPNKEIYLPDPALEKGQLFVEENGSHGYQVRVYKKIIINDKLEKEELISKNNYLPLDKIIRYGTKPIINHQ